MGAIYGMIAPVVARLFGILKMNVVFSQIWSFMGVAGLFSPVIGVKLTKGSGVGIDPTRYVNCSIFTGVCFIVCSATLLIIRGYVNARDRMMEKEGHTDSDLADYTGVTVPFGSVFPLCLAKSHEKYKRVNKIIIITLYSFTFCKGHECKLFSLIRQVWKH